MSHNSSADVESFKRKLGKQADKRRRWAAEEELTAYRLFDERVQGTPLVIDRYNKSLHLTIKEIPGRQLTAETIDLFSETICKALYTSPERLFVKYRKALMNHEQYSRVQETGVTEVVEEYGCRFLVNLSDYQDTGLFGDQRLNREWLRNAAWGKKILNLFCYTGSFSVYAAIGGASSIDSVDLSRTYLDWAQENFKLNRLPENPSFRFLQQDSETFLKEAVGQKKKYDLIVLDPPTFSNSRKMESTFKVERDHPRLINLCLSLLSTDGILLFSTNQDSFQLKKREIESRTIEEITARSVPFDYPAHAHYAWLIRKDAPRSFSRKPGRKSGRPKKRY